MAEEDPFLAFVCEISEDKIKAFDFKRRLFELPITEYEPELGEFITGTDECYYGYGEAEASMKVTVVDGVVHVKTNAISPRVFELNEKLARKYEFAVWSPLLGLLSDCNDVFSDMVESGGIGKVTVKYAPKEDDTVFEIIDVEDAGEVFRPEFVMTPWTIEESFKSMSVTAAPQPYYPCMNLYEPMNREETFVGICVKISDGPSISQPYNPEFSEKCAFVFHFAMGLLRWRPRDLKETTHKNTKDRSELAEEEEPEVQEVGKWYRFTMNDPRKKKKNVSDRGKTHIAAVTCTTPLELYPQLETHVIDGQIEITTSFLFNHELIESEENRQEMDWQKRRMGFKPRLHVFDLILGRVELFRTEAQNIVVELENHWDRQSPEEREKLKDEAIVVVIKTRLLEKFYQNSFDYPNYGLFFAKSIHQLMYLNGGKIIWQNDTEEPLSC